MKVHRADCPNILNEKKRLIPVQWEEGLDEKQYEVNLVVHSDDRNYLLSDIVTTLQQCNVYLKHEASMKSFVQFNRKANTFLFSFEFQF